KLTGRLFFSYASSAGSNPFAPLIQGSDGNFYGTTVKGGTHFLGEVFILPQYGCFVVGGISTCTLHASLAQAPLQSTGPTPTAAWCRLQMETSTVRLRCGQTLGAVALSSG